jgi:hypothetical protein
VGGGGEEERVFNYSLINMVLTSKSKRSNMKFLIFPSPFTFSLCLSVSPSTPEMFCYSKT